MTVPAWMANPGRRDRQQRNAASARQERAHAARVGGRVQPGSGSSWRAPGDVRSAQHLDELKLTAQRSFSITNNMVRKIVRAAASTGKEPRLIVDFVELGVRAVVTFEDIP